MATVDKVSVKVVPDTSGFAKQMRAELAALKHDLQIPVTLDTNRAHTEMTKLRRQLTAKPVRLPVQLTTGQAAGGLGGIRRPLAGLSGLAQVAAAAFDAMATAVTRAAREVVTIRRSLAAVTAQTAQWAGQMARAVARVENLRRAWRGVSRSVTTVAEGVRRIPELPALARNLALSARAATQLGAAKLGDLARTLSTASTYTDRLYNGMNRLAINLDRVARGYHRIRSISFSDVVAGIRRMRQSLGNAARSAGRFGTSLSAGLGRVFDSGITKAGQGIAKMFSGLSAAAKKTASGLGKVSRTGVGLVAVLALIAPAVGLVSSVLASLPAVLAGFGAAAGAVALGMEGIKAAAQTAAPAFKQLKTAVSGVFQTQLTPVFQRLADVLLPGITAGMQGIARELSRVAAAFAGVLTSQAGMRQLNTILANTSRFIAALVPVTTRFTRTMLTLAEVGSGAFGGLAAGISQWVTQFSQLIATAQQTGVLRDALSGLGAVLGALGGVFNRVFAAGLEAMAQLGGPLATLISGFGDVFVALMPVLTTIASLISTVLGEAFRALAPVIAAITPSLQLLGTMLGTLLVGAVKTLAPILTTVAKIFNEVLLLALQAIQPILPPLIQFFTRLGTILGDTLLGLFQALKPTIAQIALSFGELLLAITPLLPQIANLVAAILPPLVRIIRAIAPLLTDIARTALPILVDIIKMVIPVIGQLVAAFAEIIPFVLRIGAAILEWLVPKMQLVYRVIREVWPKAKGIIQGAMDAISGIIRTVMGIITLDWERAWQGLKDFAEGIIDGIVSIFRTGKQIISSVIGGIGDLFSMARSDAQSVANLGTRAARGMSRGTRTMSAQLGRNVRTLARAVPTPTLTLAAPATAAAVPRAGASVLDATPRAVAAADALRTPPAPVVTDGHQDRDTDARDSEIGAAVERALSGWQVQIDRHGIASLVNTTNRRNARR